jgi:hypothetical protein
LALQRSALISSLRKQVQGLSGAFMNEDGEIVGEHRGFLPVFSEDPIYWDRTRMHLPLVTEFFRRFQALGGRQGFTPKQQESLRDLDAWCQKLGFCELVSPLLDVGPDLPPRRWSTAEVPYLKEYPALTDGRPWSPWGSATMRLLQQCEVFVRGRRKIYRKLLPGDLPKVFPRVSGANFFLTDGNLEKFQERAMENPSIRLPLRRWMEPGVKLCRRFLVAAGRALQEKHPLRGELTRLLVDRAPKLFKWTLLDAVVVPGLPVSLGGPVESPDQAIFMAHLARRLRRIVHHLDRPEDFSLELDMVERVLKAPVLTALDQWRHSDALWRLYPLCRRLSLHRRSQRQIRQDLARDPEESGWIHYWVWVTATRAVLAAWKEEALELRAEELLKLQRRLKMPLPFMSRGTAVQEKKYRKKLQEQKALLGAVQQIWAVLDQREEKHQEP